VEDVDYRTTTVSLIPKFQYFIAPNTFLGIDVDYDRTSREDWTNTSVALGPNFGYAFSKTTSKTFPYLGVGFHYRSTCDKEEWEGETFTFKTSGYDIVLGGGFIISIKDHIGFVVDIGYHIISTTLEDFDESYSSNMFGIGFGFAGLIF
ncbi:MAG: outer membrane beta-barrel protein, partial [bacterium]